MKMKKQKGEPIVEIRYVKPGCYRLAEDVTNPSPDRRATRDWRNEVIWKQGTRILVIERKEDFPKLGYITTYTMVNISVRHARLYEVHATRTHQAQWNALADKLVEVPEDLDYLLERIGAGDYSLRGALEVLIGQGKLTLADIEGAYFDWLNSDKEG